MRRIMLVAAVALVAAACGDAAEPPATRPPDATAAPAAPSTTTPSTTMSFTATTSTSSTTTSTTVPGFSQADAQALYDEIVAETGWVIPAVAAPDFAFDACERVPTGLYEYAEDLLLDEFLGWGAELTDANRLLAAQLGWALGASRCDSGALLEAGPPTELAPPECGLEGWRPFALPWADEAGAPDSAEPARLAWIGPVYFETKDGEQFREELVVSLGRDAAFIEAYTAGSPIGRVDGGDATVIGFDGTDTSAVEVRWQRSPRYCDAWTVQIAPAPAVDDLADFVEQLVVPGPFAFANDAEILMAAAVDRLSGYRDIGGEPSHGGQDAVYAVGRGDADFWLYATPRDAAAELFANTEELAAESVGDVVVHYLLGDEGAHIAWFRHDGFLVTATTSGSLAALEAFAADWVPAWLGSG